MDDNAADATTSALLTMLSPALRRPRALSLSLHHDGGQQGSVMGSVMGSDYGGGPLTATINLPRGLSSAEGASADADAAAALSSSPLLKVGPV